jgi:hypothetical protein
MFYLESCEIQASISIDKGIGRVIQINVEDFYKLETFPFYNSIWEWSKAKA